MSRVTVRLLCLLAALLCGTLGALVDSRPAYACECSRPSTGRALRLADAVFLGTVTEHTAVRQGDSRWVDLRFQVNGVYKGTVYADHVVASTTGGASCGSDPPVGSSWVVFSTEGLQGTGDRAVDRLVTSLCLGNLATDQAPALLGRAHSPLAGSSDRQERAVRADQLLTQGVRVGGLGLLGLAVVLGVGLALVWKRPGTEGTSAGPKG